jgi:hypothetical protein
VLTGCAAVGMDRETDLGAVVSLGGEGRGPTENQGEGKMGEV